MAFDYVKFDMISSSISILTMLAQKSLELNKNINTIIQNYVDHTKTSFLYDGYLEMQLIMSFHIFLSFKTSVMALC